MSQNLSASSHLRVEEIDINLVPDGDAMMLAIRSLVAHLSHEGLQQLVASAIPEEPLQVSISNDAARGRCTIHLQATRMGFNARIRVGLEVAGRMPGGILINVDPHGRWSPIDRVMLGIAQHNLDKLSRKQAGFSRLESTRYQIDLQSVIRDKLLDSHAPVRWDARLERIDGSPEGIRVEFVSMVTGGE
ncbi:MAG: hypothetical protein EA415_00290 [Sphaerobacteraceae bacterium]|nr:MAG: hypothetical protein EA415_00290 [Sphaerobacteraceae bacterium]